MIAGISAVSFTLSFLQILLGLTDSLPVGLILISSLVFSIAGFVSLLALYSAVVEEGQSVAGAYQKSLRLLLPFLWVSSLVGITMTGGFFAFFIPAILLAIWLSFSYYALIAEDRRGTSALVQSWHYVKGYWCGVAWRLLFLGLVVLFAMIVLAAPIYLLSTYGSGPEIFAEASDPTSLQALLSTTFFTFLSTFVLTPLSIIYSYGIYLSLRQIKEATPLTADEEHKIKRNITIFYAIGIIGILSIIIISGASLIYSISHLMSPSVQGPSSFQFPSSPLAASVGLGFTQILRLLGIGG